MAFPPPPTDTIDWSDIGFRLREVNGHIESHYSLKTGEWTAPEFVTDPFLRIHGMCPGLNYGQQAYEGMKAFRRPDGQIQIFRPQENAARIAHSAAVVSIPPPPPQLFLDCVHAAVSLNAAFVPPHDTGAAMYIRPLIFGSSGQLGLNPPEEYTFCVYVLPVGVYHGTHPVKALILDEFDRAAPHGVGGAKVGGNYAPVLRWSEKARQEGFGITLHLDSAQHLEIDEFSTSGFIGVKQDGDKVTLVRPDSAAIIDSVTSKSVMAIGKSLGFAVETRPIKFEELASFSEVFAAGTAAALVPIKSITRRAGNHFVAYMDETHDEAGPVCLQLLDTLKGIQLGRLQHATLSEPWCMPVAAVEQEWYQGKAAAKEGKLPAWVTGA